MIISYHSLICFLFSFVLSSYSPEQNKYHYLNENEDIEISSLISNWIILYESCDECNWFLIEFTGDNSIDFINDYYDITYEGIFESETPKGKNNTKGIKEVEESQSKAIKRLMIHIDPSIITTRQICITMSIKKPIDYESASNTGFIKYLASKEKKNFSLISQKKEYNTISNIPQDEFYRN